MTKQAKNITILGLLNLILMVIIWLLYCEFHSKQQSYEISETKLLLDEKKQMNDGFTNSKKIQQNIHIGDSNTKHNHRIQSIKNFVETDKNHTILFQTLVSQPTMTTQKIQTLMTGSQIFSSSSIIDAFFSTSVSVDNIITQIRRNNGKVAVLGDDTWGKLFQFTIQYPCLRTFDIWDWQSCDEIIYKNFLEEVQNRNQLTIGHFLSLDHIGHASSSITHPSFKIHKDKISKFIQQIIDTSDNSQVLLVTGDHGMRDDGNHGGATQEEAITFLFAHSKQDNLKMFNELISDIRQPDITTTLSLLLNVPIPTNSIGVPIFIPTSFLPFNQSQHKYKQLYTNIHKHFSKLISQNDIQCQQLTQFPTLINNLSQLNIPQFYNVIHKIQQNCLSHLSHNQLNITTIIFSLYIMTSLVLTLSILLEISFIEYVVILSIALPHSFSWLVIRNSSTYFLISLLILIILQVRKIGKNILILVLTTFVLCQLQPIKNGQFSVNIFESQYLSNVLMSPQFYAIFSIILTLGNLCLQITTYHQHFKSKTPNTQTHFCLKYELYSKLFVFFLINISYILKQFKAVQARATLNIFLTVVSIVLLVINTVLKNNKHSLTILLYYMLIFLGNPALPLYCIITILMKYHKQSKIYPYYCYALAHFIWWILGNRYEYSSIDIIQSYVFGTSYHYLINPLCLCIYMMAPYIVVFLFICRQNEENHKQRSWTTSKNKYIASRYQELEAQEDPVSTTQKPSLKEEISLSLTIFPKMLLLPLLWLVCCFINLTYNNQKILYTVAYVPMTVIEIGKILTMIIIVIVMIGINMFIKCFQ